MNRQSSDSFFYNGVPDSETASLAGRELPTDLVSQVSKLTMGQLLYILGHIQKLSAQAPVTAQALLAEHPQICYALLHAESLAGMLEEPLLPMTSDELHKAKTKARRMREELENHELPPPADVPPPPPPEVGATTYGKAPAAKGFASHMGAGHPYHKAPGALPLSASMGMLGFQPPPPPSAPPPPTSFNPLVGVTPLHGLAQGGMLGPLGASVAIPSTGFPSALVNPHAIYAPASPPVRPAPVPAPPANASPAVPASSSGATVAGGGEDKNQLMNKLVQLTPDQIAQLPEDTKVQLLSFLQQHAKR